jgi:NOL1/NOP2/sun family putative RNA methylase
MGTMLFKSFEEKFKPILGEEFPKLVEYLSKGPRKCIRVNTLKTNAKELKERLEKRGWKLEEVPWYKNAFFVEAEEISKTLEYFLGYYFIQDASSLIPPLVLNPSPTDSVLDLCAAPGSKTTFMAELMQNKGLIVAIDIDTKRLKALAFNLQKIGITNTIVFRHDGRKALNMEFDKILVDAPCTGTGTTNLCFWSRKVIERLSRLQMLREDGSIVYSTCSIDPEENEAVIDYAINQLNLKVEKVHLAGLKYREGLTKYAGMSFAEEVKDCIRIYPFDNQTEGFFVCKLKK